MCWVIFSQISKETLYIPLLIENNFIELIKINLNFYISKINNKKKNYDEDYIRFIIMCIENICKIKQYCKICNENYFFNLILPISLDLLEKDAKFYHHFIINILYELLKYDFKITFEQLKTLFDIFLIIINVNGNMLKILKITNILLNNINLTHEYVTLLFDSYLFGAFTCFNEFNLEHQMSYPSEYMNLHIESVLFMRFLTLGNDQQKNRLLQDNDFIAKLIVNLREHTNEKVLISILDSLSNLIVDSHERSSLLLECVSTSILYLPIKLEVHEQLLIDENYTSIVLQQNEQENEQKHDDNENIEFLPIAKKKIQVSKEHVTVNCHLIKLLENIFHIANDEQILQLCDEGIISTLLLLLTNTNLPSDSHCSLLNMLLVIYRFCPIDVNSDEYTETMKQIEYHCSQPEKGTLAGNVCDEQIMNPHLYQRDEAEEDEIKFDYNPPTFNQRHYLYIFGLSFIDALKQRFIEDKNIDDRISMFSKYIPATHFTSSLSSTLLCSFERICRIVPYDPYFLNGWLIVDASIHYFIQYLYTEQPIATRVLSHNFLLHGRPDEQLFVNEQNNISHMHQNNEMEQLSDHDDNNELEQISDDDHDNITQITMKDDLYEIVEPISNENIHSILLQYFDCDSITIICEYTNYIPKYVQLKQIEINNDKIEIKNKIIKQNDPFIEKINIAFDENILKQIEEIKQLIIHNKHELFFYKQIINLVIQNDEIVHYLIKCDFLQLILSIVACPDENKNIIVNNKNI
jgi:hypothetical protein